MLQDELAETSRDCGHLRLQAAQLTHNLREGEKRLERCREQLAVSLGREERQLGKAKQTYARLKSAWAQAKGTSKAAGAISAAARELRPVEIVSLYEEQRSQVRYRQLRHHQRSLAVPTTAGIRGCLHAMIHVITHIRWCQIW